jgi:glycosyltransferase involved in cell wall biosynthesis
LTELINLNKKFSTAKLQTTVKPTIASRYKNRSQMQLFSPASEGRKEEGGLQKNGYFKQSYEDKPLVSIITIVYNGEQFLEETIQSVINQTYDNIEYIIIDGGSTDETLDIIRQYNTAIDYWVSEKDKGIANAFNKGVSLSKGEWILCLNADDALADESVIGKMMSYISNTSLIDFIYGDFQILCRNSNDVISQGCVVFQSNKLLYGQVLPHPALMTNRRYFLKHGIFDESFKVAMDYEWMLRGISNENVLHISMQITNIRDGGISTTNQKKVIQEILRAIAKNKLCSSFICTFWISTYFYSRFYAKSVLKALGIYHLYTKIR